MSASPLPARGRMPVALYALTAGSFGIGCAEFVIMGLLLQVAADLQVSIAAAGLLVTGYALGVTAGAPVLTLLSRRMPRKAVLLALMAIYTVGNAACALAPDYATLMAARVVTSLTHGTFFGVGAVVATGLVPEDRKASAISVMFSGLTLATLLGMPAGAWLGLHFGWRSTFWAMSLVGVVSLLVIALLVPRSRGEDARVALRDELATIARPQVLLGLLMTMLGFAGVFVVITYVQPLLTRLAGFGESAVSPILLMFGGGMVIGNLLGGRLADRRPTPALLGTLLALAAVLGAMSFVLHSRIAMVLFVGLLGVAAFATVSPLQLRVLRHAAGAGQNLASSFNIAAFNLGNAAGAWLGGVAIERGPGLESLPWVAALVTLSGLAVAGWSVRLERRSARAVALPAGCAAERG
ncbi:DHA1 family inner membrane transport protein [Vulcaniibacterium tengchongense]|uniref:DHA1 family inner membrane transport protein n=2 Tax=Vulcaniibacterium tengchongense TaxID=1273429 RepID=A0A3N4V2W7_9GAMM|nr:DHA1 family inner membrane transport protein [Vulcaniibacterium tengchongense]